MKALVFFANGTEEIEALTPVDYLRRVGVDTILVGLSATEQTGSHGITVKTDICAHDLGENVDFDMLVLPGGMPGTNNLEASPAVQALIKRAVDENKFIAAICAAPRILGKLGLLRGKTAVCYPGFEKYLDGAFVSDKKAVRDGNIITAVGMGAANEFSLELVSALFGEDKANEAGKSVRFF